MQLIFRSLKQLSSSWEGRNYTVLKFGEPILKGQMVLMENFCHKWLSLGQLVQRNTVYKLYVKYFNGFEK